MRVTSASYNKMKLSLLCIKTILRIAIIVCAGAIIVVSAITIGIIDKSNDLGPRNPSSLFVHQLETLVDRSFAAAVWLILFNIIVILWEVVYIILPVVSLYSSLLQRYSVVLLITDAGFCCVGVLCSLASTVACIVYADSWGEPPEVCDRYSIYYIEGLNCDQKHLEGTNGSAAFFCLIQVSLLVALGAPAAAGGFSKIFTFIQSHVKRNGSRSEHDEQSQGGD